MAYAVQGSLRQFSEAWGERAQRMAKWASRGVWRAQRVGGDDAENRACRLLEVQVERWIWRTLTTQPTALQPRAMIGSWWRWREQYEHPLRADATECLALIHVGQVVTGGEVCRLRRAVLGGWEQSTAPRVLLTDYVAIVPEGYLVEEVAVAPAFQGRRASSGTLLRYLGPVPGLRAAAERLRAAQASRLDAEDEEAQEEAEAMGSGNDRSEASASDGDPSFDPYGSSDSDS